MEFSAILSAAYEDLGYQSSPDATVVARLKRYANEGMSAILAEPGIYGLVESTTPYTFTSAADQALYTIPEGYEFIRDVSDSTNQRHLESMTLGAYRRVDPKPSVHTGTPTAWVPVGWVPVAKQPSAAAELFIKSTSASDTGTAYIQGVITGGYKRTASVVMTGVTAVTFSASITSWIEITDVYIDAAAVGTVTILQTSGSGTELGRITIGQKRPSYQGFYLWTTPSAAIDYVVDVRRQGDLLVQDTDEPPLPRDFHRMLTKYITFRDWERKDDTRSQLDRQQYNVWLSRLKYRLANSGDSLPVARNRQRSGISRLGPWFPASTVVRW